MAQWTLLPSMFSFPQLLLKFFFLLTILTDNTARSHDNIEEELTRSLLNCPLCAGSEPCLRSCRTDGLNGVKQSWEKCLRYCMGENDPMVNMFLDLAKTLGSKGKGSKKSLLTVRKETAESQTKESDLKPISNVKYNTDPVDEEREIL